MRKLLTYITILLIATGCGKSGGGDTPPQPPPVPGVSALLFPAKDELCNQGTVVSATQSKVVFKWSSASNADSYSISIKNLLTGASVSQPATQTQLEVTLDRNTPYSWNVVSLSSKNTDAKTLSDTWKFYNSGPGVVSYAPFPAEAVSPAVGASVATSTEHTYNVVWKASDVDNDILNYDLYFGDSTTPPLVAAKIKDSFYNKLPVRQATTFYWKVVTRDSNGNTSESGLFQFKVL
ncbi:hypothetical protein [Mucilaginibacter kameinonensis]|uniref:hypothetical protein n=1 Tax=Mucilaginibacter kameinonensis TaxID=452286 RepID=UPI000EF81D20|nr:hypothetical protein [Mucilaginibacter kameinonensis]